MIINSGNILDTYTECDDCNAICYRIIDCTDGELIYYTDLDYSVYVGKVISYVVEGDDETVTFCATVESFTCRDVPEEELPPLFPYTIEDCHDTCEDCYPQPEEEPVPFEPSARTVRPGYDTPACTPQYWDKIKCKFSEAL